MLEPPSRLVLVAALANWLCFRLPLQVRLRLVAIGLQTISLVELAVHSDMTLFLPKKRHLDETDPEPSVRA
jgi:hypothetical protein